MDSLIGKDQVHILLKKIYEVIDSIDPKEWPSNIKWDAYYGGTRVYSINITLKRCNITISDLKDKLRIEFRVGMNCINGVHPLPNFMIRLLFPGIWKKWKKVCNKLLEKHTAHQNIISRRELEAQRDTFNNMYYTQFPEEIDNILLNDEDEDE